MTTKKTTYLCMNIVLCCSWEIVASLLFLPLRGDLQWLPSSVVPRAVVPNLYLHSACSSSPTRIFLLRHLRTVTLDGRLVLQGSCCIQLVSFLLHLLAVFLGSRLARLPSLADSRLDTPCLSLAETSGLTPQAMRCWECFKFESQTEASTQNTSSFLTIKYFTFVFKLFHYIYYVMVFDGTDFMLHQSTICVFFIFNTKMFFEELLCNKQFSEVLA